MLLVIGFNLFCAIGAIVPLVAKPLSVDLVFFLGMVLWFLLVIGTIGLIRGVKIATAILIFVYALQIPRISMAGFHYGHYLGFEFTQWITIATKSNGTIQLGVNVAALIVLVILISKSFDNKTIKTVP